MGELQAGTLIGGKYELLEPLGAGSMGALWRAKQGQRSVAIKLVSAPRDDFRDRFDAEVSALATLRSNYIVQVYDWGRAGDEPYMVMELLEGGDVADLLAKSPQRRLEPRAAVDCVVEAAAGLAEAHARGIVHRDLKPANLFFDTRTKTVKVVDFGIAGAGTSVRRSLTEPGTYMGTPNYSAPEQFEGYTVGIAADVWALGAILYELLSGKMAFPGDNVAPVMAQVKSGEPPALGALVPGLAPELVRIVERCLEKLPQRRYASVGALIRALAPFGSSRSQAARDALDHTADASAAELAATLAPTPVAEMSTIQPTATTNPPEQHFYTQEDLSKLLLQAPTGATKPIVFMLGAGFSRPVNGSSKDGIPATDGVVARLMEGLSSDERSLLEVRLRSSSNKYQEAFDYINAVRDADEANTVIRRAVLEAYRGPGKLPDASSAQEDACQQFEEQLQHWRMPPGVQSLGAIIAKGLKEPALSRFSKIHLTTNFDPLLAIAVRQNNGNCESHPVETDYAIPRAELHRCMVVHLHGRWRDGKTLHNHLDQPRPALTASLRELLSKSILVVLGYGGWVDVFMQTLTVAAQGEAKLDVRWAFFDHEENVRKWQGDLLRRLAPLGDQVRCYGGVNTNTLFQQLEATLLGRTIPPPAKTRRLVAIAGGIALLAAGGATWKYWPGPVTPGEGLVTAGAGGETNVGARPPTDGGKGGHVNEGNGGVLGSGTAGATTNAEGGGGGVSNGGTGSGGRTNKPNGHGGAKPNGLTPANGGNASGGNASNTAGATNAMTETCQAACARKCDQLTGEDRRKCVRDKGSCRCGG
jgi:serine/threonine protein kinase